MVRAVVTGVFRDFFDGIVSLDQKVGSFLHLQLVDGFGETVTGHFFDNFGYIWDRVIKFLGELFQADRFVMVFDIAQNGCIIRSCIVVGKLAVGAVIAEYVDKQQIQPVDTAPVHMDIHAEALQKQHFYKGAYLGGVGSLKQQIVRFRGICQDLPEKTGEDVSL